MQTLEVGVEDADVVGGRWRENKEKRRYVEEKGESVRERETEVVLLKQDDTEPVHYISTTWRLW